MARQHLCPGASADIILRRGPGQSWDSPGNILKNSYLVPYYTKDPKGDHNFDNHPGV